MIFSRYSKNFLHLLFSITANFLLVFEMPVMNLAAPMVVEPVPGTGALVTPNILSQPDRQLMIAIRDVLCPGDIEPVPR
jgi:hypothetical protein